MPFDWTTFALEILNFLVLLWILQRFLYRPVLAMLDARQQRIQDETQHALQLRQEAEALLQQYQTQLADWAEEREAHRRQLAAELQQQRNLELDKLKTLLAEETTKLKARDQALIAAHETALQLEAASAAYQQAAAMLQRLASPQLTQAIGALFLEDLHNLPATEQTALNKAAAALPANADIEISAAHPLETALRDAISQALQDLTGRELSLSFKEDPRLIAGIRAVVGECQLHANLRDELGFFQRQSQHG